MVLVAVFVVRAVDPIEYVQEPVGPHEEDVISRQVLHLPVALQHDQLRQDGDRFQVDGEGPQQFDDRESASAAVLGPPPDEVRQQRDDRARRHPELVVQERILRLIVRGLDGLLEAYRVDDRRRAGNVQDLHHRIVHGIKRREEVQVPRDEDDQVQLVRTNRNT